MVAFAYTARTKSGEKASGSIEANDKRAATQQIERMGYVPISVTESSGKAAASKKKKDEANAKKSAASAKRKKTGKDEVAKGEHGKLGHRNTLDFTRELKDLVTSGMTIGQALESLKRRSSDNKVRAGIVEDLYEDIRQGTSLSESMGKHPETFNSFYTSMVRAGEASGQLPDSLENIITHMSRIQEAKESVTGALIYPVILIVLMVGAVAYIMIKVIPQFTSIFEDLNMVLPLMTRILIAISDFLASWKGVVFGLALIIVSFLFFGWTKSGPGRRTWHRFLLKVPVLKSIFASNVYSQFARTLGGLMKNGVPVLNAMKITTKACGNVVVSDELSRVTERVADGEAISKSMTAGGVFPSMLIDMLSVGEQSGDLPRSLDYIADRYDNDLRRSIGTFTKLIEPALLLFMAFVIGFIAIALLSAVFQISTGMSNQ